MGVTKGTSSVNCGTGCSSNRIVIDTSTLADSKFVIEVKVGN